MTLSRTAVSVLVAMSLSLAPLMAKAATADVKTGQLGKLPSVVSSINLPYSPDVVWTVINNPQLLTQHAPNVRKVSLVGQSGQSQDLSYAVKMNPLLPQFNYVLRYQPKGNHTLTFQRVSGSFKTITGYWKVLPQAGGKASTLVYSLAIDPGFAAPQPLITQAIKMDVPRLMQHAKNQVALFANSKMPTVANDRR